MNSPQQSHAATGAAIVELEKKHPGAIGELYRKADVLLIVDREGYVFLKGTKTGETRWLRDDERRLIVKRAREKGLL
jgi:hypothetical protein